jgi:hypothetical protein
MSTLETVARTQGFIYLSLGSIRTGRQHLIDLQLGRCRGGLLVIGASSSSVSHTESSVHLLPLDALQPQPAICDGRMRLPTVEDTCICEGRGLLASNSGSTVPAGRLAMSPLRAVVRRRHGRQDRSLTSCFKRMTRNL